MTDLTQEMIDRRAYQSHGVPAGTLLQRGGDGMVRYGQPPVVDVNKYINTPDGSGPTLSENVSNAMGYVADVGQGLLSGAAKGAANINELIPGATALAGAARQGMGAVGIDPSIAAPTTLPGQLAEGVGQALPGMLPAVRALKAAGYAPLAAEVLGGLLGDFATSGKEDAQGIANLVGMIPGDKAQEVSAAIEQFITSDNATIEDLNSRLVGALPGAILSRVVEGLGKVLVAAKNSGVAQSILSTMQQRAAEGKSPIPLGMAIEDVSKSGGVIPPSRPAPTPDELNIARQDQRQGADIVSERLNVIVPESERVAGGTYTPGRPDGRPWLTLTPEELSVRGPGFSGTDDTLRSAWEQTLSEVSQAARNAVERTGATWQAFDAAAWDRAMRLPLRSQLWYELSGEAFRRNLPDISHDEHMMFLDLIGATSARARPGENLERALAVLSQRVRGVPVDVDVTIPSTVSSALLRGGADVSSDLANKTGMFSDTLALTAGIPVRYPISVNDVWVGKAFGISDADLSSNQALHEVFGKYMNKIRDHVNGGIGHNSGEIPHQSWHLQARQWVEMRAADEGIDTMAAKAVDGSDYAGEWDGIVSKLEGAGIQVPDGKITRDILMDPRFADALRQTTPAFRSAPKATVEFGTLLTENGRAGADLYSRAIAAGDRLTQAEYLKTLTTTMYNSARGKPTEWEKLVRVATGGSDKVTRIYSPTSDDPFAISGTFQGNAAPNIRVPLKDMSPDQIAYLNAMVGKGIKQKAMAAAEINRIGINDALPEGAVETGSIRFDWSDKVPEEMLTGITQRLGEGFEVSAMRYPDGMLIDINPRFGADGKAEGPSTQSIDAAINFLVQSYGVKNPKAFRASFKSEYGKNYVEDAGDGVEYTRIIDATVKGWKNEAADSIAELTGSAVSRADIDGYLTGSIDKLPLTSKLLEDGGSGFSLSSVRGRASTIRKSLQQRLSDHDEQLRAWEEIGKNVDRKMGEQLPKWRKRLGVRDGE